MVWLLLQSVFMCFIEECWQQMSWCCLVWTVKSGHDSFELGSNFCTAVLSSEALFKSASYEIDLKTPKYSRLFMRLLLLCILNGGKELSLSRCALTTARGCPSLRSGALSVTL